MLPLAYAYNAPEHEMTNLTSFSFVLSRHSTGPTPFDKPTALATDATPTKSPEVLRARLLHFIATVRQDEDR